MYNVTSIDKIFENRWNFNLDTNNDISQINEGNICLFTFSIGKRTGIVLSKTETPDSKFIYVQMIGDLSQITSDMPVLNIIGVNSISSREINMNKPIIIKADGPNAVISTTHNGTGYPVTVDTSKTYHVLAFNTAIALNDGTTELRPSIIAVGDTDATNSNNGAFRQYQGFYKFKSIIQIFYVQIMLEF